MILLAIFVKAVSLGMDVKDAAWRSSCSLSATIARARIMRGLLLAIWTKTPCGTSRHTRSMFLSGFPKASLPLVRSLFCTIPCETMDKQAASRWLRISALEAVSRLRQSTEQSGLAGRQRVAIIELVGAVARKWFLRFVFLIVKRFRWHKLVVNCRGQNSRLSLRRSRNGLQLRPNRELDWKKGNGGENIRPLFSILVYKTRFRSYNPVSRFSLRKPRVSLRNKKGIESYAITRKKILEGVKDAIEAAMEQPANWSCIVAVNGQGQIVRTEFPCGGSHKYNDKEVGEVSYFTVNGWGDWDPESKDFQYNVALRVESFGDGLDWEELQTDLETIGVELLGARDSKLLEKMEEIKCIGIKNLEKGTPLYRFFKKQQREFRKHRETAR